MWFAHARRHSCPHRGPEQLWLFRSFVQRLPEPFKQPLYIGALLLVQSQFVKLVICVAIHDCPFSSSRTLLKARERCAFTVPTFIPVVLAISSSSISSAYRNVNTSRCFPESFSTIVHIAEACSFAISFLSTVASPVLTAATARSCSSVPLDVNILFQNP